METKICNKCKKEQNVSCFHKDSSRKDGLRDCCKQCVAQYQKQYNKSNALKKTIRGKQYYKENTPQITKQRKQHYENNKPQLLKQKKQQRNNNALFEYYSKQLELFEEVRPCPKNPKLLEVKCAYCGKWVSPTNVQVSNRLQALNSINGKELRFYCSENCKISCPIFNQNKYPKGFKKATSREVVPLLRQLVLERDNYTCQKCWTTTETAQLHVHHEKSYTLSKIMANDPDNCITLCKECHKWIHSREGCKYSDLQCPQ